MLRSCCLSAKSEASWHLSALSSFSDERDRRGSKLRSLTPFAMDVLFRRPPDREGDPPTPEEMYPRGDPPLYLFPPRLDLNVSSTVSVSLVVTVVRSVPLDSLRRTDCWREEERGVWRGSSGGLSKGRIAVIGVLEVDVLSSSCVCRSA